MTNSVELLDLDLPDPGSPKPVADGVYWLRMPLPFELDHINLWMIKDEDGWCLVDTGIKTDRTKDLWRAVFSDHLADLPVTRLICTHAHPDHMGLAGWLVAETGARFETTKGEWYMGRLLSTGATNEPDFYQRHFLEAGCSAELAAQTAQLLAGAQRLYEPVPPEYFRISEGESLSIGGRDWRVIIGLGHAFEHACLYCAELDLLIGGDHFLPKITPTVVHHAHDPLSDPLREFLTTNRKFLELPAYTQVLPSHNAPFTGLHVRIREYEAHHTERLDRALSACERPATAFQVAETLFDRTLDAHQSFFAIGEALSHLRYLETGGKLARDAQNGVTYFRRV